MSPKAGGEKEEGSMTTSSAKGQKKRRNRVERGRGRRDRRSEGPELVTEKWGLVRRRESHDETGVTLGSLLTGR